MSQSQLITTTIVKAARWLDAEHTKLCVLTDFGLGNWPAQSAIGDKVRAARLPIEPFRKIKSARWPGEDRTRLLATVDGVAGEVELTAALWPDLMPGSRFIPAPEGDGARDTELSDHARRLEQLETLLRGMGREMSQMPLPPDQVRGRLLTEIPVPHRPAGDWSIPELLTRAANEAEAGLVSEQPPDPQPSGPLPMDDASRRRRAKARVRQVASSLAFNSLDQQLRYEEALMAHNGNIQAMQTFEPEAAALGISIKELVDRIVSERTVRARRMMQVKAIQEEALRALDAAAGDEIEAIEQRAVSQMSGPNPDSE